MSYGHIIHCDTLIPLILIVGNVYIFIAFLFIKLVEMVIILTDIVTGKPNNIVGVVIRMVLNLFMFIVVQLINILILINQRVNEYKADDFALKNGYGENLIEVLYLLEKIDLGRNLSLLERLKSSHPNITDRISKLEEKLSNYDIDKDTEYVFKKILNETDKRKETCNNTTQEIYNDTSYTTNIIEKLLVNKTDKRVIQKDVHNPEVFLKNAIIEINRLRVEYGLDKIPDYEKSSQNPIKKS